MRSATRLALAAAASATFVTSLLGLGSPAAHAGPLDLVPRGDIAYDLLGSLAAAGKLPGLTLADLFRGDRLYTRSEMADLVLRVAGSASLTAEDATALRALQMEFAPELRGITVKAPSPTTIGRLSGDVKIRALTGPTAVDGIGRASFTLPAGSSGFAAFSLGNWRDEWYDPGAPQHGYPLMETAYVRENGRFLDVLIGRMPLRWGPGYAGAMLLSDESPSMPQIRAEKTFVPGGWFRRLGPLHFEQFDGQFFEADDPTAPPDAQGTRRYLVARRLETAGPGRWSVSLGESLKSTRLPDPVAANVLPLYLYQNEVTASSRRHLFGGLIPHSEPDTYWKNYVADVNTSYRVGAGQGIAVYNDLLLDDVKAPKGLGLGGPTPRKLGEQFGVYAADLFHSDGRIAGRLEYATIDPGTYANVSAPVTYTNEGVPLGHAAGPNANVLFARIDLAPAPKFRLALEGATRRRKDDSTAAADTDRVGVYATYAIRRDAFVGARLEHLHVQNGETSGRTRAEVDLAAGF